MRVMEFFYFTFESILHSLKLKTKQNFFDISVLFFDLFVVALKYFYIFYNFQNVLAVLNNVDRCGGDV